jgi:hypothetical protein
MDCKTARAQIKDYVEGRLELGSIRSFLNHVNNCEDCMFELQTGYLVYEGIKRMDRGDYFDFEKGFEARMKKSRNFVVLASRAKFGLILLVFLASLGLVFYGLGIFTL